MLHEWNEHDYQYYITKTTEAHNLDNISRTKAYQKFYMCFPEIKWAFLASMVSRNAGWNMTDLVLPVFRDLLSKKEQRRLFMTYERANWLIFSDAYPQLMVYALSRTAKKPLFHLLEHFHVSRFMVKEWSRYWKQKDHGRLLRALIINEQNVIHKPVIRQDFFKTNVFRKLPYLLQDLLFINAVILPTRTKALYGSFVHDFTNLTNRITLGKQLAAIIFAPPVYEKLLDFAINVEHTGSRKDYERFLNLHFPKSLPLRMIYPAITHKDIIRNDWFVLGGIKKKWFNEVPMESGYRIGSSFYKRRSLLHAYYHAKNVFKLEI